MKSTTLIFSILFAAGLTSSRAQGTWTQKADFGGGERVGAVAFAIGSKGYIGTGYDLYTNYKKDFWEFDPVTNAWTQKANFGGEERWSAVGFSIGSKGYVGTGNDNMFLKDFWEYDPVTNAWTHKANFGGKARDGGVGFSIGNKGYIGTGNTLGSSKRDFWEYDPTSNTWTQKADFGGTVRYAAVGFAIGSKGYIGTGYENDKNDFWEYDPTSNTWTQKADFGGTGRQRAVGFSIGNKGYIGTGVSSDGSFHFKSDFWEYDPLINTWIQKANFGGVERCVSVGFSIGNKGYLGTGYNGINYFNDFWEYAPSTTSCAVPASLSATKITSSSAKLNWDTVPGAEGYKIRYKAAGASVWTKKISPGNGKTIIGLTASTTYNWEVKTYCQLAPTPVASNWSSLQEFTTESFRLGDESLQQISFQIYPNPAEDHATIQFTLPQSSHVSIKVYDVRGKEIETVMDGDMEQGDHSLLLNTNKFSKEVYLVKMISYFGIENQKLIVE